MKMKKRLILSLLLTIGSFLTLPAYAWPEVDHMNMCGGAAKTVRAYGGNFRGWAAHDNYIAYRGKAYYLRSNCPTTVAPVKKAAKKKVVKRKVAAKPVRIAKSSKAKAFKRTVKYDLHADCVQVDRMNSSGPAVRQVRRAYKPTRVAYRKPARPAQRTYNYFKKRR